DADPPIGDAPDDLTERYRDHDEAEPGSPQGEHREDGGGGERQRDRAGGDRDVIVTVVHDAGRAVGGDPEQAGVAERDQPSVADQDVDAEGEDRRDQDLARDVEGVDDTDTQGNSRARKQRTGQREPLHTAGLPKRPWGRTTSTISSGRKSTT